MVTAHVPLTKERVRRYPLGVVIGLDCNERAWEKRLTVDGRVDKKVEGKMERDRKPVDPGHSSASPPIDRREGIC